jgi:hypothetical protein
MYTEQEEKETRILISITLYMALQKRIIVEKENRSFVFVNCKYS